MQKLFLQGKRLVGKSTLLKTVLLAAKLTVSGFYVERWVNEHGQIIGFELCDAKQLGQRTMQPIAEHCFIQINNGSFKQNLAVFETYGRQLLETAQKSTADVILLDEIGGIELQTSVFTQKLLQLLKQPRKIIGVYKSDENFHTQKLPETTASLLLQKKQELCQTIIRQNGQIITLKPHNQAAVKQQLLQVIIE